MPTLFIRTLIVYSVMFAVLRLMGKRQISEMQPFDLAVTLLIANLASIPMSEPAVPLFYGLVPIIGLFIVQRLLSYASLKSERIRRLVCGNPLAIIEGGVVNENIMRSANYSFSDLTEQLRLKDVFSISQVEHAILETNGSLSVLLKGAYQTPTREQMRLDKTDESPALMLVSDGKADELALMKAGMSIEKLNSILKKLGIKRLEECLFAILNDDGTLHIQRKDRGGQGSMPLFFDTNTMRKLKQDEDGK